MSYYVALVRDCEPTLMFDSVADVPDYLDDDVERLLEVLDIDEAATWLDTAFGRLWAGPKMLRAVGAATGGLLVAVPLVEIRPVAHPTLGHTFVLDVPRSVRGVR